MKNKPIWIAGISRGHNASVSLLKDGELVFSIEEERLSRKKYDGSPFAAMTKILNYTDKLDYLIVAHTQSLEQTAGKIDFTGDDIYTGLARKLGLIENSNVHPHPQVIDLSNIHHKLHAACAFYNSGFDKAVAVIVDGSGSAIGIDYHGNNLLTWEVESIIECSYPSNFKTIYKHYATREPICAAIDYLPSFSFGESGSHQAVISDRAGIVKTYEAVTHYCGWNFIEAGKTMGLSPYGDDNDSIPQLFIKDCKVSLSNRNLFVPNYPNGAFVNSQVYDFLTCTFDKDDYSSLKNRRDLAYAIQIETQNQVLKLIKKSIEDTGCNNVIVSGGYGLNCVANTFYQTQLPNANIYIEPVSNDAGTSFGAAKLYHHNLTMSLKKQPIETLYCGLDYNYSKNDINSLCNKYNFKERDVTSSEVADLLIENIVAIYQGKSEIGARGLGNRSILFNPSIVNGKAIVNKVKKREEFRPFAGTILLEHASEWFEMNGLKESPFMMYALKCKDKYREKIPSIIHVDGTCRIQTITQKQNGYFYELIQNFYLKTHIPVVFNTSLNLNSEPIVETINDAFSTLQRSEIQYLYLPEFSKLIVAL